MTINLDEIEARAKAASIEAYAMHVRVQDSSEQLEVVEASLEDIPALVAEVRRLREENVRLKQAYEIRPERAVVQRDSTQEKPGTVEWWEHEKAWSAYARQYPGQSSIRMHERAGFSYGELVMFLGYEPTTWRPR